MGLGPRQPQIVETYVSYLRRKLDPLGPPLIRTRGASATRCGHERSAARLLSGCSP